MRLIPTFLLLSLLLTACGRQVKPQELSGDAKLRQQITGVWSVEHGVIRIASDGTSSANLTNGTRIWAYRSTWELNDGVIIVRITSVDTQGTTNCEPVGTVEHLRIIRVTDHSLVYDGNGQPISLSR